MQHTPVFKFGDVTNLGDARFAAGVGAKLVGFNFDTRHAYHINPLKAHEIIQWLSGPQYVAEYRQCDPEQVRALMELIQFDYVLFPFSGKPDPMTALPVPFIVEIGPEDAADFDAWVDETEHRPEMIQWTDRRAGAVEELLGDEAYQQQLHRLNARFPLLLNLPFVPDNVVEAAAKATPYGMSFQASQEEKVGYNDFGHLIDLVEAFQEM